MAPTSPYAHEGMWDAWPVQAPSFNPGTPENAFAEYYPRTLFKGGILSMLILHSYH